MNVIAVTYVHEIYFPHVKSVSKASELQTAAGKYGSGTILAI
jgi:hypothetical protein